MLKKRSMAASIPGAQEHLHQLPEFGPRRDQSCKPGRAILFGCLKRLVKQARDCRPLFRGKRQHDDPLLQRPSATMRKVLAFSQSRRTVRSVTPNAAAISTSVNPAK